MGSTNRSKSTTAQLAALRGRPLAFLGSYVRRHPGGHLTILLSVLFAVVASVSTTYGLKHLIDVVSIGRSAPGTEVWAAFLILCGLVAVDNLSWRIGGYSAHRTFVAVTFIVVAAASWLAFVEQEALFRRYALPHAFSASANLAAVGAALGSCRIHRSAELGQRQRRLAQRINLFDRRIETADSSNSLPIRMITVGSETAAIALARELLDEGFYTSVTFFPTVAQGKAGIRVCLTSDHDVSDIERLCRCIIARKPEAARAPEMVPAPKVVAALA